MNPEVRQRGSVSERTISTGATRFDAFWRALGPDGRWKTQCKRGFLSRGLAVEFLDNTLSKVRSGEWRQVVPMTLAEYATEWIKGRLAAEAIKPSTAVCYTTLVNRVKRAGIGDKPLDKVTSADVNRVIAEVDGARKGQVGAKLTANSKRAVLTFLGSVFETACAEVPPRCRINPVKSRAVHRPRVKQAKVDIPDPKLVGAVIDATPDDWRDYFTTLVSSGLREGEGLALRGSSIDWTRGTLRVDRTTYRRALTTPKTDASNRVVDVGDQVLAVLSRRRREVEAAAGQPVDPDGLVFPAPDGKAFDATGVRRVWARAAKRAGVRHLKVHALRHVYASLQLESGQDLKYLSVQLGHASIRITVDLYGHLLPGHDRRRNMAHVEARLGLSRDGAVMALDGKSGHTSAHEPALSAREDSRAHTAANPRP
jgi:integrase